MKPASKPRVAAVEQPFGCAPPRPYCPVWCIDVHGFAYGAVDGEEGEEGEGAGTIA